MQYSMGCGFVCGMAIILSAFAVCKIFSGFVVHNIVGGVEGRGNGRTHRSAVCGDSVIAQNDMDHAGIGRDDGGLALGGRLGLGGFLRAVGGAGSKRKCQCQEKRYDF